MNKERINFECSHGTFGGGCAIMSVHNAMQAAIAYAECLADDDAFPMGEIIRVSVLPLSGAAARWIADLERTGRDSFTVHEANS